MASLKDKVILITGSGDEMGIGAAIAQYTIQFHPKLVLTGRDKPRLDRVGDICREAGLTEDRLLLVVADVDKDQDLERMVDLTVKTFHKIDVLVNNAAIVSWHSVLDTSMQEFDSMMSTNVRSPFYLTKLCIPHLIKTKGTVVNISSLAGLISLAGQAAYSISKSALDQFTKVLAMEMASHGVRVNSVNPGVILTNIQMKNGMSEEKYAQFLKDQTLNHPLGRNGEPVEVAKAVVWLASDESSFTTGQLISVDGGRRIFSH